MKKIRFQNAMNILDYAIKHNMTVGDAAAQFHYNRVYVKKAKQRLKLNVQNGNLSQEEYEKFLMKYDEYKQKRKDNKAKQKNFEKRLKNETIQINEIDNKNKEVTITTRNPINHITTLEELLEATNVDLDVWKVKNYVVNKWDVTSWKSGSAERRQNFQVKVWLIRIEDNFKAKEAAKIFKELIRNYKAPKFITKNSDLRKQRENNLFELSLFDLHLGKLAWVGETGENYDTKIAIRRFHEALDILLKRAESFNYDRILFPVGNDFFNTDTIFNTTTSGTFQDEDLRWQKTFTLGTQLMVDAINILKTTNVPIDIIVIPGNHDFERSYYLGSFLEAWFRNDETVNVNNGATPRKYYRYGETLLGFTHGYYEKESSLPLLMASDYGSKKFWSETKFHEWHLGHFHRKIAKKYIVARNDKTILEDLGVTIRYLSSLTGTEEWHNKKGFIGNIKAGEAYIWNKDAGLIAQLNANINIDKDNE